MTRTPSITVHETHTSIPSLLNISSDELLAGLSTGLFTSVDLVNAYTQRIHNVNSKVHAVLELNPDAHLIATTLDGERSKGRLRGPLHGLPVLIKGNIGTLDRMQTNAGSWALQNSTLPADSTIVTKLRDQGLVILGKACLTEWSMIRSSNSTHGWNAITGQTWGAYCEKQCPGGSSGGSAVAADLGLAWATIGTETDGSIISPSERNNVVGIKPTVGLTSRHLVVPISERQDTVGPIAGTVKDAARLLHVIAGSDDNDAYTLASRHADNPPDYLKACKLEGLQGKKIGIPRNVIKALLKDCCYMMPEFETAIGTMKKAGAVTIEDADFTAFSKWQARKHNPIPSADFVVNLAQYLEKLHHNPQNIHNIHDLRTWTQNCPKEGYPRRDTAVWDGAIEEGMSQDSLEFSTVVEENEYLGGEGGILGALERHELDAIVLPSKIAFSIPALVGSPIITVPLGVTPEGTPIQNEDDWDVVETGPGIPFGISFLGHKWEEEKLIEMAYAFEQRTLVRGTLKRIIEPIADLVDMFALAMNIGP
ncbi:amidase signature enzyme [Pleomassaria siparia CBS 279.74]|uniref:Amidase signature enzyme n=1 Tax=Pleomassaria siparia CBS 279.74 TaxID=1314801 RepID=A0A6G1JRV3_9PLEO|nr:amidase signature enzyme [Pleomassaria siparia CBS 279.74]